MSKKLVIVESPSKAKTIKKYLGEDFQVMSSVGHIRDLEKGDDGVDVENGFQPHYVISSDKKKVVKELKKAIGKDREVWLATDDDREGEAIAWHLCKVLNLDEENTKRIVFREITKSAIQKAIADPRTVDIDLVNAQQARRILDRLVGFELSPLLWKKVKGGLSAGRVQSVALKLVVEREREIRDFKPEPYFRVQAYFIIKNEQGEKVKLEAKRSKRISEIKEAEEYLKRCVGAVYKINDIKVKPTKKYPAPPFTTSTLQQQAGRKYSFGVNRTMSVAQKLYEAGYITYMRTDATRLSGEAIGSIGNWIESHYGKKYHRSKQYASKQKGAQEAHEAIRPTDVNRETVNGSADMRKLYDLIRKRTIACQMAPAEIEKTTVDIGISTMPEETLKAKGEVMTFDGFIKVYVESTDEDENKEKTGMLPPLKVGQELELDVMQAIERYTQGPARYSEPTLVRELEKREIGRPSTYAPTISKIKDKKRGYIEEASKPGVKRNYTVLTFDGANIEKETKSETSGATKKKFYATDLGMLVTDFLEEHFDKIMDYDFTADIEEKFDVISDGKLEWRDFLASFYSPFHEIVQKTLEDADRATGERILGKDPISGNTVLTRMGKYGPVAQIGKPDEIPEGEKPKYASLLADQSINTIDLESALELFKLPRGLGEYKGKPVQVNVGRYGPYVKYGDKFISAPKNANLLEMSMEEAQEIIDKKLKEEEPIGYYEELPIQKGVGRYGPFVKWNGKFYNISKKKYDPDTVDAETAIEIIKAKNKKDSEKIIQEWPALKIKLENGRWGPFIRFGRKNVKLPRVNKKAMTREKAAELTLDEVKEIIEAEIPGAFDKGKKGKKAKKSKKSKKGKK